MAKLLVPVFFLIASYFLTPILPWYAIGILALLLAYLASGTLLKTFGIYFAMGFAVWYGIAMMKDAESGSILSSRIAVLFGNIPKQAILLITGLIGGVTAGLGGIVGNAIRGIMLKPITDKQTVAK